MSMKRVPATTTVVRVIHSALKGAAQCMNRTPQVSKTATSKNCSKHVTAYLEVHTKDTHQFHAKNRKSLFHPARATSAVKLSTITSTAN